jgi:hypothetical protein
MILKSYLLLVILIVIFTNIYSQTETILFKKLKSLKEISEVTPAQHGTTFSEAYELMITQIVDHNKPN